jgi:hypothetical protein
MWAFDNNKMQLEAIVNPDIRDIYIENKRRKGMHKGTLGSKSTIKVVSTPK